MQDVRKFPGKIFCQTFPGSGAAGAAGHFPALGTGTNFIRAVPKIERSVNGALIALGCQMFLNN